MGELRYKVGYSVWIRLSDSLKLTDNLQPMKAFSNIEELTKTTFFTDLIEAVQNSYSSYENTEDDEYYYYYDYESPAQAVANQVSASLLDFNPALRSASKGSAGCSTAKLTRKSPLGRFSNSETKKQRL